MGERLFGARVRRREDARLVTGRGRYVDDVTHPGLLHVAVHRSPHAHARIVRVDPTEARRRPGVIHVLLPADVAAGPYVLMVRLNTDQAVADPNPSNDVASSATPFTVVL